MAQKKQKYNEQSITSLKGRGAGGASVRQSFSARTGLTAVSSPPLR